MPLMIEHDAILIGGIGVMLMMFLVVRIPLLTLITAPFFGLMTLTAQAAHSFPYLNIIMLLVAVFVMTASLQKILGGTTE